jgi:hypothetical protein
MVNFGMEADVRKMLTRGDLLATIVMSMREEEIWFVISLRM